MRGKLIVIDGVDGSGKQTQAQLLYEVLKKEYKAEKIEFPNYSQPSSALIKMYLNGDFGQNPDEINPYAASAFYTVDRFASYKTHWEKLLNEGTIIIADRYVTSNAIHQAVKLKPEDRPAFFDWLYDFEYKKCALPEPDLVLFLDMPPSIADSLLKNRYEGDENKKDIHEKDRDYAARCYDAAVDACVALGWEHVFCSGNGVVFDKQTIFDTILEKVKKIL